MRSGVLAVDQGTSGSKAVLIDSEGAVVARGAAALGVRCPQPGWVEQDAEDIWASVVEAVSRCLRDAGDCVPVAVAVTNQRESAVVWDRSTGAPAGPVIGWQDSRTAAECERLAAGEYGELIRARSGLAVDPMFSATKLRWLLERAPGGLDGAARGTLCAGTVDAWLVWKLTGGAVLACEAGNASRTQLMELRTIAWDPQLLELFGVPAAALPEIRRSDGGFGTTVAAEAIPAGLPVAAVLADSHAALYGNGCFQPGAAKATYGTGTSVMTPVADVDGGADGVARTLAWLTDRPTWALEGNIIASGAALDWMAHTLGLADGGAVVDLAATVDDAAGVFFVPAFAGLGAPYWDRGAEGVLAGLTRGTTPAHLARAAVDAVALQICDVLDAMDQASGEPIRLLHADGGASASALVMQRQADLAGRTMLARDVPEMSAVGVGHLAAVACELWSSHDAPARLPRAGRTYEPAIPAHERDAHRAGWRAAVARARGHAVAASVLETAGGGLR